MVRFHPTTKGASQSYASWAFPLTIVRFEAGATTTWNHNINAPEIQPLTGFSALIDDKYVIGIWLAPFWKLYAPWNDDPWGVMVGYAW